MGTLLQRRKKASRGDNNSPQNRPPFRVVAQKGACPPQTSASLLHRLVVTSFSFIRINNDFSEQPMALVVNTGGEGQLIRGGQLRQEEVKACKAKWLSRRCKKPVISWWCATAWISASADRGRPTINLATMQKKSCHELTERNFNRLRTRLPQDAKSQAARGHALHPESARGIGDGSRHRVLAGHDQHRVSSHLGLRASGGADLAEEVDAPGSALLLNAKFDGVSVSSAQRGATGAALVVGHGGSNGRPPAGAISLSCDALRHCGSGFDDRRPVLDYVGKNQQ